MASISTIILTVVEVFRYGPPFLSKNFAMVNSTFRIMFAVAFLLVRVISWPVVSIFFWMDTLGIILEGGDGQQRTWVAILFLVSNIGLTTLQFIWAHKISAQVLEMFSKSAKKA